MISTLITIVFAIIILGVVWWAIQQLLPLIPLGEPFRTIVYVLMMLIAVLVVLWIVWQLLVAAGLVSGGTRLLH
jgi:hypothetical protein